VSNHVGPFVCTGSDLQRAQFPMDDHRRRSRRRERSARASIKALRGKRGVGE